MKKAPRKTREPSLLFLAVTGNADEERRARVIARAAVGVVLFQVRAVIGAGSEVALRLAAGATERAAASLDALFAHPAVVSALTAVVRVRKERLAAGVRLAAARESACRIANTRVLGRTGVSAMTVALGYARDELAARVDARRARHDRRRRTGWCGRRRLRKGATCGGSLRSRGTFPAARRVSR